MSSKNFVFMDFVVGGKAAGRIVFELFDEIAPSTAQNFRALCSGEYANNQINLHYRGSRIFKIEKGKKILGGDVKYNNGTGEVSIYGGNFNDENFQLKHHKRGMLSTVFQGINKNNSQFCISLNALEEMDGKQIVFGQIKYGFDTLKIIEEAFVDLDHTPIEEVYVIDSGILNDDRQFLNQDPLSKEGMKLIREHNKNRRLFFEEEQEEDNIITISSEENQNNQKFKQDSLKDVIKKENEEIQNEKEIEQKDQDKLTQLISKTKNEKMKQRLLNIQLKLNQQKILNKELYQQEQREQNPNYNKILQKEFKKKKIEKKKQFFQKYKLNNQNKNLIQCVKQSKNIKKQFPTNNKNQSSIDHLYKAHQKRISKIPIDMDLYNKSKNEKDFKLDQQKDRLGLLIKNLKQKEIRNKKYSNQNKNQIESSKYVNESNKKFNEKVYRFFGNNKQFFNTLIKFQLQKLIYKQQLMEEFVINYYTSQMFLFFTQYINFFKYNKSIQEKQLSNFLQQLKETKFDQKSLEFHKKKILSIKKLFNDNFNENKKKLQTIKQISLQIKNFQSADQEQKQIQVQQIFYSYLYEYLYKYEKLNTIKYMNNFQELNLIFEKLDISKYTLFSSILKELNKKKIDSVLTWCKENKSKLKKNGSNFEYKILLKLLIKKIEQNLSQEQLLDFIQNYIPQSTSNTDEIFNCVQIVIQKDSEQKVQDNYSWKEIKKDFYNIFFEIEGYEKKFIFENIIQLGIKHLKNKLCNYDQDQKIPKNSCPVCTKWIFLIGENIQSSNRENTLVRCSESNQIINEQNQPICFNDDYIYSLDYVKQNMDKHGGVFVSPQNNKMYQKEEIKKIYFV